MCNKLFNKKECCLDCMMKYIPFGKTMERLRYTDEEAQKHHNLIDKVYKNENNDPVVTALLSKIRGGRE